MRTAIDPLLSPVNMTLDGGQLWTFTGIVWTSSDLVFRS